ncbi:hypothetical protein KR009_008851 [Drosophila setifemur]|nr:hypothetical protein KR009_008851 [Drosophila setifemur]
MHQIPLHLAADPVSGDCEYVTMTKVMCPRNLIECELFLKVLKKETDRAFRHFAEIAPSCLTIGRSCMTSKDPDILKLIFMSLNENLCRAPSNTTTFMDSILARCIHYMRNNQFLIACQELEYYDSLDPKLKTADGKMLSLILSCVVLYLSGSYRKARAKLDSLKEMKGKNDILKLEITLFLTLLAKYEEKIQNASNDVKLLETNKEYEIYEPYESYKLSRKIPFASSACEYVQEKNGIRAGVFATSDIRHGEIVLAEVPEHFQFSTPFVNCDLCEKYQELIYTCPECRYKSYCSKLCMDDDWSTHETECYGFKIGVIPMLEASILFRLFVESAEYILPAVVDFSHEGGVINGPKDAWIFILKHAQEEEKEYNVVGEFLASQPDFKLLSKELYCEVVVTAFRLAVFIYNDTKLIEKYFHLLSLEKIDMINVIGSILLRLGGHVLLNSQHDELRYQKFATPMNGIIDEECEKGPLTKLVTQNGFTYHGINGMSEFVKCNNVVKESLNYAKNEVQACTSNERPINQFVNKILNICLNDGEINAVGDITGIKTESLLSQKQEEKLKNFNTSKRCQLMTDIAKYYQHYVYQYFTKPGVHRKIPQIKSTLCVTLKAFRQCCGDENVKVIYLANGQFIGVTTTEVRSGEELVVCSEIIKPHELNSLIYTMRHSQFGLSCIIDNELFLLIEGPSEILLQNKTFLVSIKKKLCAWKSFPEDYRHQHNLMILFGTYNGFLNLHFPEGHALRILGELKFAMFLAWNGFLDHASDIMLYTIEGAELEDRFIEELGYYRQAFCVIQKIMEQYTVIMIKCPSLDLEIPTMLLSSCWLLLKRLNRSEDLDEEESSALYKEYYTCHYNWRTVLNSCIRMP